MNQERQKFGVSRSTVWRWHAERGLRVVCVGAVTRIRESDLEALAARVPSLPFPSSPSGIAVAANLTT
jgi:hypothetical protein